MVDIAIALFVPLHPPSALQSWLRGGFGSSVLYLADLLGDADDAAGGAGAGIARLEGLLVAALAQVVGAAVDDDGALFRRAVWSAGAVTS